MKLWRECRNASCRARFLVMVADACPVCGHEYGPISMGLDVDPAAMKDLEQRRLADDRRRVDEALSNKPARQGEYGDRPDNP